MQACGLTGTIDLKALPFLIVELSLQQNWFSGTVCFTDLPCQIQKVNLGGNQIRCAFVSAVNIPEGFHAFVVNQRLGSRAKVQWIGGPRQNGVIF